MSAKTVTDIPNMESLYHEWIQWHKDMKANIGKKAANSWFMYSWKRRGGDKANTTELRKYLKSQGVEIESSGTLSSLYEGATDFGDSISGFFGMTKTIGIIVLAVVLVMAVIAVVNISRQTSVSVNR